MSAAAVMDKFEWERLVQDLPPSSPLWAHDERCPSGCRRQDGSRLSVSTLKHMAGSLLRWAQATDSERGPAGTRIHPGIGYSRHKPDACPRGEHHRCEVSAEGWHEASGLCRTTGRHRSTIIAALGHLEACGLIAVRVRAHSRGVPRQYANEYMLTVPSEAELARRGAELPSLPPSETPVHDMGPAAGSTRAAGEAPEKPPADSGRLVPGPAQPAGPPWRDWFTKPADSGKRQLAAAQAAASRAARAADSSSEALNEGGDRRGDVAAAARPDDVARARAGP